MTAILFGLMAFGLWIVDAHDSYREAAGHPSAAILKPRTMVYVVVGLLVLMMVLLIFGTISVNG